MDVLCLNYSASAVIIYSKDNIIHLGSVDYIIYITWFWVILFYHLSMLTQTRLCYQITQRNGGRSHQWFQWMHIMLKGHLSQTVMCAFWFWMVWLAEYMPHSLLAQWAMNGMASRTVAHSSLAHLTHGES